MTILARLSSKLSGPPLRLRPPPRPGRGRPDDGGIDPRARRSRRRRRDESRRTDSGRATPDQRSYVEGSSASTYANPSGNPVLHGSNTFAIYWDPTDHYSYDWQNAIDGYLHNVGAASGQLSTVFAVDSQYTDKSDQPASYAQTFKGAYTDTRPYPFSGCEDPAPLELVDQIGREFGATPEPICITSTQVANEVERSSPGTSCPRGSPTSTTCSPLPVSRSVSTPANPPATAPTTEEGSVASYENSFCSYHADINPGGLATGDGNTSSTAYPLDRRRLR